MSQPDGTSESSVHEVVIIGGGPAGLTAAIYTARALLDPVVLEGELGPFGEQPGGQLMLTTEVENYPGFPDGVLGPELIEKFKSQAARFGARFIEAAAEDIDLSERPFEIRTRDATFRARSVILAMGASPKRLGVPGESEYMGLGVSTCATCDGAFFKDRRVVVVGGGDSAMEEALFLTRYAEKVTVIHRRDTLRASKIMQERAASNPKIDFLWNSKVVEIVGEQVATAVRVEDVVSGEVTEIPVDGVFVAIGHAPNTDIVKGQLELDELGYIKTQGFTRTSVEGVFAAGDAADRRYRQAVTAAGLGCMAAIDASRWLEETED
jgi:thioredoxin reductase (NADPH)